MLVGSSQVSVGIQSTWTKYKITASLGDANSDIVSVSTSKDLNSPTGSFQIELVPKKDSNNQTWFDKVSIFDFVEIEFKGIKDDELVTVMRGLVDRVTMSENYEGGPPRRSVLISGRDLGSLFTDFQFYVIPALKEQQKYAISPGYGLMHWKAVEKGIQVANIEDIYKFLIELWESEIDFQVGQLGHILGYIDWDYAALYPNYKTTIQYLNDYYGGWWNAFSQYQDAPWHELFVYDDNNWSWFILRPSRLKDAKGNYHPRVKELLSRSHMYPNEKGTGNEFKIVNEEKILMAVEKDITNVHSYYLTYPTSVVFSSKTDFWSIAIDPNLNDISKSKNPYLAVKEQKPSFLKKFGFRPMEKTTVYAYQPKGQMDSDDKGPTRGRKFEDDVLNNAYINQGIELNLTLVKWFLHNPLLLSGTISIPGTNRALVGTYMTDSDEGMEYYVEGVDHVFTVFESFRTSLKLSRGMPTAGLGDSANDYFF